jgi:hypothetical protein
MPGPLQRAASARKRHLVVLPIALLAVMSLAACGVDLDAPVMGVPDATFTPTVVPVATATEVPEAAASPTKTPDKPEELPTPEESPDPTRFTFEVSVDAGKKHAISPLIYGVADPTTGNRETLEWLGATLARWGGNARTRHNWEINASNAGSDFEYTNIRQGGGEPGSASLGFIQRNDTLGLASILTIPNIGWVAKDTESKSLDVPEHGGPPVVPGSEIAFTVFTDTGWIQPYDPTANRERTSLPSLPSKGGAYSYPPDLADGKVYQDEWVAYLSGKRQGGSGPVYYAMDNEPELWADSTHVDVHPVRPGYDSMLSTFLAYARAVKKADPAGLVLGPESWGVTGYLYSALDEGGDRFGEAADRKAHGDEPWLQWFLKSVRESDEKESGRSLDVLGVHYYPNSGEYQGGNEPAMQDKRMQAPRALWDGMYVEQSWVSGTEWANLALVRRLNGLIERYYPGTKLGLTEWNFGGEDDISGAIATADALGIFGRENVHMASYWGLPPRESPTGWAFRLYRNYDGKGSQFGSESVEAVTEGNSASAYGALSADGRKLTLVLINKDREKSANVRVRLSNFEAGGSGMVYRYGGPDGTKVIEEALSVSDPAAVQVSLPPMSLALVALDGK